MCGWMRGACLSSVLPALAWTAAITAMALVCKWVGSFKKLLWEQTGRERETQIVWRKKARGPGWACRGPRGQCFWSLFPTQYSISWCISCPGSVVIEDSNDDNNDVNRMKASNPLFFPPRKVLPEVYHREEFTYSSLMWALLLTSCQR